jgi:hypothetical protein
MPCEEIGPGTTTVEQIATASFSATGAAFSPVLDTLFTGLTLGPDNYYLVLSSSTGLGWEVATYGITPVTAPGVSIISNAAGTLAAYPGFLIACAQVAGARLNQSL